jgi:hypothetical protein
MEFTSVTDQDILARSEINEKVILFLNGDAVIQEEREIVGRLAETGCQIIWSLFVRCGRGRVGRRFAGGGERNAVGAGVCVVELHIFPTASAVWLGGVY